MAALFQTKPVTVEAMQYRGVHDSDIERFTEGKAKPVHYSPESHVVYYNYKDGDLKALGLERCYEIRTLEGRMLCRTTDWIIKGTEGEFYPCKDSVFQRKYEPVGVQRG